MRTHATAGRAVVVADARVAFLPERRAFAVAAVGAGDAAAAGARLPDRDEAGDALLRLAVIAGAALVVERARAADFCEGNAAQMPAHAATERMIALDARLVDDDRERVDGGA